MGKAGATFAREISYENRLLTLIPITVSSYLYTVVIAVIPTSKISAGREATMMGRERARVCNFGRRELDTHDNTT
jgi:hypothetical protein